MANTFHTKQEILDFFEIKIIPPHDEWTIGIKKFERIEEYTIELIKKGLPQNYIEGTLFHIISTREMIQESFEALKGRYGSFYRPIPLLEKMAYYLYGFKSIN